MVFDIHELIGAKAELVTCLIALVFEDDQRVISSVVFFEETAANARSRCAPRCQPSFWSRALGVIVGCFTVVNGSNPPAIIIKQDLGAIGD